MNYVSLNVFVHLELVHGSRLFKTKNSFIKLNPLIFLLITSAIHEILKQETILPKPLDSPEVTIRDHDDLLIPASALAGGAEVAGHNCWSPETTRCRLLVRFTISRSSHHVNFGRKSPANNRVEQPGSNKGLFPKAIRIMECPRPLLTRASA